MPFDWFRRRHTQAEEPAPSPAPEENSSAAAAQSPQPQQEAIDYLAFAKAAYANIKARQEGSEPAAPVEEPSPPDDQVAAEIAAQPPSASAATVEAEERASTPSPSGSEAPPEEVQAKAAPETDASPQVPATKPQAFFDTAPQAAQRLEALEATAVVEEPSPTPTAPAETPPGEVDLSFDAGFRWSAEILAAQGRRPEDISVEEITWLQKLRRGLGKTRLSLINQLKALVGRGPIDQDAVDEIETVLLQADVGLEATEQIIAALQQRMRKETLPPEEAVRYLKKQMQEMLSLGQATFAPEKDTLNIWLIVGVNGVGKTTTIGKIAHLARQSDYRCLIAAADTFRAAAVEQLKIWGTRAGVEVIANPGQNTDPAAVVFDAISAAQAREVELLLVDTAGRLQNKKNLMDELGKIRRVIDKKVPDAKVEALLVLDATQGQNGLRQAEVFAEVARLSGVVLTKLDSTAKGGIALAVTQQLELPIRFIGAGEGIADLRPFSSYEFVEALLSEY